MFDEDIIRHALDGLRRFNPVCGHEELNESVKLAALFDYDGSGGQVCCLRKVNPADGVRIPELFKLRFNAGIIDDGIIKPRDRRILLDIAILRQEFDAL